MSRRWCRFRGPLARVAQIGIGLWLLAAPAVLDYGDPARANDRIVGPVAASFAVVALWDVTAALRWAVVPLAAWLLAAPLLLGYDAATTWVNSLACAVGLAGAAPWGPAATPQVWGGWRSLVGPLPGAGGHRAHPQG